MLTIPLAGAVGISRMRELEEELRAAFVADGLLGEKLQIARNRYLTSVLFLGKIYVVLYGDITDPN